MAQQLDLADELSLAQVMEPLCKTSATHITYVKAIETYMKQCRIKKWTALLVGTPEELEDRIIQAFREFESAGFSPSYKNKIRAALQKFYDSKRARINWGHVKSQIVSKNPDSVNRDRAFTKSEIAILLQHASTKYRAMILIMATAGARVDAVCKLKYSDIGNPPGTDLVVFKFYAGSNAEYISFGSKACLEAVRAWIKERISKEHKEGLSADEYLFPGEYPGEAMTIRAVEDAVIRLMKKAGIKRKKVTRSRFDVQPCHGLRKYFAGTLGATNMPSEIREALEGHFSGTQGRYRRPPAQKLLAHYLKYGKELVI